MPEGTIPLGHRPQLKVVMGGTANTMRHLHLNQLPRRRSNTYHASGHGPRCDRAEHKDVGNPPEAEQNPQKNVWLMLKVKWSIEGQHRDTEGRL
jgi:hypothetical protein